MVQADDSHRRAPQGRVMDYFAERAGAGMRSQPSGPSEAASQPVCSPQSQSVRCPISELKVTVQCTRCGALGAVHSVRGALRSAGTPGKNED